MQGRLLRVLQEGVVDVIGSDQPQALDVRIVAATNRDLETVVKEGGFREDLYYRLNVLRIHVPPLRARRDDILPLAQHFVEILSSGRTTALPLAVQRALMSRAWRGNVRELRNACERMVILSSDGELHNADLPTHQLTPDSARWLEVLPEGLSLVDLERQVISHTLQQCGGNVSEAARKLGVPRHILAYRMEKYGLRRDDDAS